MRNTITACLALCALTLPVMAAARPTVVELYTSQGCSSCPEAELLVRQLARDPALLALSFHVHYFDYLGWKDPFASEANTARQKAYSTALHLDSVFTPQIVVDGVISVIGSDSNAVEAAVSEAETHSVDIPVRITPQADGNLRIAIGNSDPKNAVPSGAVAWEVHFNRGGYTNVLGGENGGQVLPSTNYVTRYVPMTLAAGRENDYVLPGYFPEDGVAVILQKEPVGRIIGAAMYMKPPPSAFPVGQRADTR